jgi:hypothetical protein
MKKILFVIMAAMLMISNLSAGQEGIGGYDLLLSKLNEEQLYGRMDVANGEILKSSLIITGGLVLAGAGVCVGYLGLAVLSAEPVIDIDTDSDMTMLMWPFVFTLYAIQYIAGAALTVGGAGLAGTGVGVSAIATGSILHQMENKNKIKVELKRFQPTSYQDRPGVGIGLSIGLN